MKFTRRFKIILFIIIGILLIPFIAMQFTDEVNWSVLDFVVMGILLLIAGLFIEFVLQKVKNTNHRGLLLVAILMLLLLIWAELAVGILGTPFAGD